MSERDERGASLVPPARVLLRLPVAIDVAGWAYPVEGLGPGPRVCVWVRGCERRCPGCVSPELWQRGESTRIAELAAELAAPLRRGAHLTISGGEPLDQARELRTLIRTVRKLAGDIEVLIYTGYTMEQITAGAARDPAAARLLDEVDMVIDGAYEDDAGDELRWRGSDNQRMHLLSRRAQCHEAESSQPWTGPRPLRVQTLCGSQYRIVGIPRRGDLVRIRAELEHRDLAAAAVEREDEEWPRP